MTTESKDRNRTARDKRSRDPETPEEAEQLPDISVECANCGVEIDFDTETCPMCGTKLDIQGIVSLVVNLEFENDPLGEIDCPLCGERAIAEDGICSRCGGEIQGEDELDIEHVDPVIHTDKVVFLHLDVSTGQVSYIQRYGGKHESEQTSVWLDEVQRPHAGRARKHLPGD